MVFNGTMNAFLMTEPEVTSSPPSSCTPATMGSDYSIHIPDILFDVNNTHGWADLAYDPSISTDGESYFTIASYGANY